MENDRLIVKANDLIEGFVDMSKNEYMFTLCLISKINKDDEEFRKQSITVKEFSDLLNVDINKMYSYIKEFENSLVTKKISLTLGNGDRVHIPWFGYLHYKQNSGTLEVAFNYDLAPYLLNVDIPYTKYFLSNVKDLNSIHSARIFELLKQYEKIGSRKFEVEKLKILLNISDKYKNYNDFKRRVILQAQKELKRKSDIYFDFEEIKTGKKITSIKFYIHSNKKNISYDEVAATKVPVEQITGQLDFETQELINKVKQIIKEPLEDKNIYELLKVAENNINKIQIAYEIAEKSKTPIDNLSAFLISAIKKNYKPSVGKENIKKSKFANFEEREDWDFKKIEQLSRKKMLEEMKNNPK